jgi:hypothetical protein
MWGTVLQVRGGGRGFVIETKIARYVVTAAHCFRELPPAHAASHSEERTCRNGIGTLGSEPNVSAEWEFIDPVADLAVLGEPDNEEVDDEGGAYAKLTESAKAFKLGRLHFRRPPVPSFGEFMRPARPRATSEALMQSLDGEWFSCRVSNTGRRLLIEEAAQPFQSGMSGSPVILLDGSAVGVVCVDRGPNPLLLANLPAWLVRDAV